MTMQTNAEITIALDSYGSVTARTVFDLREPNIDRLLSGALALADRHKREHPFSVCVIFESQIRERIQRAVETALAQAERTSPVTAEIVSEGGGCAAYVTYDATGRAAARAADEGGTHRGPNAWLWAAWEAERRAKRTGRAIGRKGYAPTDYERAERLRSA